MHDETCKPVQYAEGRTAREGIWKALRRINTTTALFNKKLQNSIQNFKKSNQIPQKSMPHIASGTKATLKHSRWAKKLIYGGRSCHHACQKRPKSDLQQTLRHTKIKASQHIPKIMDAGLSLELPKQVFGRAILVPGDTCTLQTKKRLGPRAAGEPLDTPEILVYL